MFHKRNWVIKNALNKAEVVDALSTSQNQNFGIRFAEFLFLNDSTDTGFRESMLEREGLAAFSTPYEFNSEMVTDLPTNK